jgi:hypothetical protein
MVDNQQLYEKILALSGDSKKAEIGALFREFGHISSTDAIDTLKKVYTNSKYHPDFYKHKSIVEHETIKATCAYIRRCAILAIFDNLEHLKDIKRQNSIKLFLLGCINDTDHSVREVILKRAPKFFSEQQLIEWYGKIRQMETNSDNTSLMKDDYTAIRRGLIYVLGESAVMPTNRNAVVEFIYSILSKPRDTDPFVCAAAAEILGRFGSKEHIPALKEIVKDNEYPAHIRAEKAIEEIKLRGITEPIEKSPNKEIYDKIAAIQTTIKILQEECEKYMKQINGK